MRLGILVVLVCAYSVSAVCDQAWWTPTQSMIYALPVNSQTLAVALPSLVTCSTNTSAVNLLVHGALTQANITAQIDWSQTKLINNGSIVFGAIRILGTPPYPLNACKAIIAAHPSSLLLCADNVWRKGGACPSATRDHYYLPDTLSFTPTAIPTSMPDVPVYSVRVRATINVPWTSAFVSQQNAQMYADRFVQDLSLAFNTSQFQYMAREFLVLHELNDNAVFFFDVLDRTVAGLAQGPSSGDLFADIIKQANNHKSALFQGAISRCLLTIVEACATGAIASRCSTSGLPIAEEAATHNFIDQWTMIAVAGAILIFASVFGAVSTWVQHERRRIRHAMYLSPTATMQLPTLRHTMSLKDDVHDATNAIAQAPIPAVPTRSTSSRSSTSFQGYIHGVAPFTWQRPFGRNTPPSERW